jgi:hypothetical protein
MFLLVFMKCPHPSDCFTQCRQQLAVGLRSGFSQRVLINSYVLDLERVPVEGARIINQRRISTRAHFFHNRCDLIHQAGIVGNASLSDAFQFGCQPNGLFSRDNVDHVFAFY